MAAVTVTATVDFGSTPVDEATFVVSDGALASQTYVEAFFMAESTAQNDIEMHKMAASLIRLVAAVAGAGTCTVYAAVLAGLVTGQFKIRLVAV